MYEEIQARIVGRLAMREEEAELLEQVLRMDTGDHIEIGVLWGGTAILAAKCRPGGIVYGIDPMSGYYGGGDVSYGGLVPDRETVEGNLREFGVEERVRIVAERSHPWPLGDVKADSVLIDGDHARLSVAQDWRNARKAARRFVIFHDMDDPEVRGVVERLVVPRSGIGIWPVFAETERMMVVERIKS